MNFDLNFPVNAATVSRIADELIGLAPEGFYEDQDEVLAGASNLRVLGAIAKICEIPFLERIRDFTDQSLLEAFDPALLNRALFVPVSRDDSRLYFAIANPWDTTGEDAVSTRFPDLEPQPILVPYAEIIQVIETVSGAMGPSNRELESIEVEEQSESVQYFDVSAEHEEPLARLVAKILSDAIRERASDVHIKCGIDDVTFSYRIDGDMREKKPIPIKLKNRIDAFILNLMGIAPEERVKRPGISGRFGVVYLNRTIDIRFERHRTYRGFHITMRILDKAHFEAKLGVGSLSFDPATLFELERVMSIPAGIIVMSGPTGSGKSTTLNAMLRELNRPEENILTLENPVEDEIPGVMHCDIRPNEFKPMITSFMRSDPDIILMGEVRDLDSAELAIEAAITGHKVLTTIHTPRASQIIERFEQLGIERWKIAQTLKAACAQRLIKLLCRSCRVSRDRLLERDIRKFHLPDDLRNHRVFARKPEGCAECNGRGYLGRTAILEIIPITPEWSDQLSKGELTPYELEKKVRSSGELPSLRECGLDLLREGKTDLEALRKSIDLSSAE